ncbi:lysine-specific demethylase 8-like isoform X2 [Dysidea avara]
MTKLQTGWSSCLVKQFTTAMPQLSIIQDIVWEQLHTGDWKDVPVIWRCLYSHSSLLISLCHVSDGNLTQAMLELDKAILMGCPILDNCIQELATVVSSEISFNNNNSTSTSSADKKQSLQTLDIDQSREDDSGQAKRPRLDSHDSRDVVSVNNIIEKVRSPSLNDFLLNYMTKHHPVILLDCMDHWPASTKWSIEYLRKIAGPRTVPVELGSRYTDDNWSQQLMTIVSFIDKYIDNPTPGDPVGYLAQHTLFDQIPQLREDIVVPDYCCLTTLTDEDGSDNPDVKINAWFGPAGTISPLHYDPEHNLLSQVVGSKYIRLYSADQSSYLYPRDGIMSNTSQVDVENPDLQEFPQFTKAVSLECILQPGQMLYIPPKCWHYVRSLETSFSVSMWWS